MFTFHEQQEIRLFLALLFPWDEEHEHLWKSVSWTFITQEGNVAFANYAAQTMDDLLRLIETRTRRAHSNVYVAMGTQRMASEEKKTADGFPKASRVQKNIVSFNSLFVDIDVGKKDAYATTAEALDQLYDFCAVTGLPNPTMEVFSGSGGLHAYWCFDRPVPQDEWKPLAMALQQAAQTFKLKFDPQVTVDACRILRVPNTFNHKSAPPTKVMINWQGRTSLPRYKPEDIATALSTWLKPAPAKSGTNQKLNQNFTSGLTEKSPPVPVEDVAANCPALADILARGGNGDSEPLWNLALLASSFTSNPRDAAHALSDQDPRYDFNATEKKLAEKIMARANNPSIGWPTCQSFSMHHPACATCPLLAVGKTPFHHARRPAPVHQFNPQSVPQPGSDPLMPTGYWRDANVNVLTTAMAKDNTPYVAHVIDYPVLDAGIDEFDNKILRFEAVVTGVAKWCEVDISVALQSPAQAAAALAHNGIIVPSINQKHARDFLVSWVSHLQTIKKYANQSAYGWLDGNKAFAFDDRIFREDGTTDLAYRGKRHNACFTISGDLQPWQHAMQLVYGNPPLELTVATAFAAPLVALVGSTSLVISLFSGKSGLGKSTAMMLAQAVWGNPRTGMSTLSDTTNAMIKKISDLSNLPVYWDELRTKDQLEKVIDIVFQITQGKGKARMNKDTSLSEVGTFTTMFVVASNYGIGDTVYHQTESTDAGGLRLFEIEAMPMQSGISDQVARQMIIPLQHNFGVAGAMFAEKLAQNHDAVQKLLLKVGDHLHQRHQFEPRERFWAMTMASLLTGAMLANRWGIARFNTGEMEKYLDQSMIDQRNELQVQAFTTIAQTSDVIGLLHEMLTDARKDGLIITDTIPYANKGKPVPQTVVDTELSRIADPWIWMGNKDGRVRARARVFNDKLRARRLNPRQIIELLKGHYHVTQSKQTIGAGVAGLDALARFGRYECYDFTPITSSLPSPGSDEQS